MTQPIGRHLLLDLSGIDPALLGDPAFIERALREAADLAGAHAIHAHFHHFGEGQGVTGMLLLRESHISIHTWPEHGYAAVDVFMCGEARPGAAARHLEQAFGCRGHLREVGRWPTA